MKQAVASTARPMRRLRASSTAKTTVGTIKTAPISRTVAVAPSTSAPAATGHRPFWLSCSGGRGHSSSTRPAVIMVSNSTSGMTVCSSWS